VGKLTLTLADLHSQYREHHDGLHGALSLPCALRCPLVDHLVLQGACAKVKISEEKERRRR